jgi:hypothetical protein
VITLLVLWRGASVSLNASIPGWTSDRGTAMESVDCRCDPPFHSVKRQFEGRNLSLRRLTSCK